jgi:septal ring factor EnvC (AmiA/AmiB activator)
MTLTTRLAGVVASAAIALAAFGATASADEVPPTDPCAQQQAKVDKATEALARVTAVFARQQERVEAAKEDVAEATAGQEKAAARKALADARKAKTETKVTKRAQQQRLAKATERLTTCQAEQPPATEAPA